MLLERLSVEKEPNRKSKAKSVPLLAIFFGSPTPSMDESVNWVSIVTYSLFLTSQIRSWWIGKQ